MPARLARLLLLPAAAVASGDQSKVSIVNDGGVGVKGLGWGEAWFSPCSDAYRMSDLTTGLDFHTDFGGEHGMVSAEITGPLSRSGCYLLEEYHPGGKSSTCSRYLPSDAPLTVHLADGTDKVVIVDQSVNGGRWNPLGNFNLAGADAGPHATFSNNGGDLSCGAEECWWAADAWRFTAVADAACGSGEFEAASTIMLEDFSSPAHIWSMQNDPVMGGQSKGTFEINDGVGIFDGEVVNVPSLSAPGFLQIVSDRRTQVPFPDVSGCDAFYMVVKSDTAYGGFRLSVDNIAAANGQRFTRGHKTPAFGADLPVGESARLTFPFGDFSNNWNAATGDIVVRCEEDAAYCLTEDILVNIETISVWGEGVGGLVHLEIQEIGASGCGGGNNVAAPAIPETVSGDQCVAFGGELLDLVTTCNGATLCDASEFAPGHACRAGADAFAQKYEFVTARCLMAEKQELRSLGREVEAVLGCAEANAADELAAALAATTALRGDSAAVLVEAAEAVTFDGDCSAFIVFAQQVVDHCAEASCCADVVEDDTCRYYAAGLHALYPSNAINFCMQGLKGNGKCFVRQVSACALQAEVHEILYNEPWAPICSGFPAMSRQQDPASGGGGGKGFGLASPYTMVPAVCVLVAIVVFCCTRRTASVEKREGVVEAEEVPSGPTVAVGAIMVFEGSDVKEGGVSPTVAIVAE